MTISQIRFYPQQLLVDISAGTIEDWPERRFLCQGAPKHTTRSADTWALYGAALRSLCRPCSVALVDTAKAAGVHAVSVPITTPGELRAFLVRHEPPAAQLQLATGDVHTKTLQHPLPNLTRSAGR